MIPLIQEKQKTCVILETPVVSINGEVGIVLEKHNNIYSVLVGSSKCHAIQIDNVWIRIINTYQMPFDIVFCSFNFVYLNEKISFGMSSDSEMRYNLPPKSLLVKNFCDSVVQKIMEMPFV